VDPRRAACRVRGPRLPRGRGSPDQRRGPRLRGVRRVAGGLTRMATTPVERETAELPFVDTWMNFSGPVEGRARVDVPNWSNTNMALQKHDLRIHDARPIAGLLSLDREGFTLVRHECGSPRRPTWRRAPRTTKPTWPGCSRS